MSESSRIHRNRYVELHQVGEGTFGQVLMAFDQQTGRYVALKAVSACARLQTEVVIHKNMNHPNIIGFYDHWQQDDTFYMCLEYAAGGELFDKIRKC